MGGGELGGNVGGGGCIGVPKGGVGGADGVRVLPQTSQPDCVTLPSEVHEMMSPGESTTLWGPVVPEYAVPATVNLS